MARPQKVIDPKLVESLARINCSLDEIAAVLGCEQSTLRRRFAGTIKDGRKNFRMSLKRKQYELAMAGNVAMCIFLGKVELGQREWLRRDDPAPPPNQDDGLGRVIVYIPDNGRGLPDDNKPRKGQKGYSRKLNEDPPKKLPKPKEPVEEPDDHATTEPLDSPSLTEPEVA